MGIIALLFLFLCHLPACSPQGLDLLLKLEARDLKASAVAKRSECYENFQEKTRAENCHILEVARLVSAGCVEIRENEPILQEDCEEFLWWTVMKPGLFFRESRSGDSFPGEYRRTGECGTDRDCQELCNDIFRSRDDREECEEFSVAAVERMNDVFNILKNPNADNLENLTSEDLDILLSISSDPLETAVRQMNQSEKKKFLVWMAEDSEAAQTIEGAEDDFSILKELFGSSKTNIITELNKSIDSGDSFVEIILKEGNDVAVGWIDDFFGDQCDSNSNYEKCVFKDYYCALSLDNDAEEEYFEHDFFIDLLDEILSEERKTSGAPSWWDTDTEAEDLDSWQSSPHNVCINMKT